MSPAGSQAPGASFARVRTALRLAIACSLLVSTALYLLWSRHWPLVGDAALIHYIGFLIQHGMAPYRILGDMNMPGSFLIEIAAMHVFGGGSPAWRCFDLSLLLLAALAVTLLTRSRGWFPPVFAACLFALLHGRDGLAEGGQRDLTMAVCLLAATALLVIAIERESPRRVFFAAAGFGLLSGLALTIKPTALPLSLAQLAVAASVLQRRSRAPGSGSLSPRLLLAAAFAMLIAPAAALAFLLRQHALGAFLHGLHTVVPYYASLGHRPFGFLLLHSISPLLPLVLLWLGVLALNRPPMDWRRCLLFCGVAFGLISYLLQARGLPYYRYPLLAFLLPLLALDLTAALDLLPSSAMRPRLAAVLAFAALCIGGLFLGPQSAVLTHRYRWWETDFISSLQQNLDRLGGPSLSGHVQCIDSISGCGATLYRMRLVPATGVLSDFLLFGPDQVPAVRETRSTFQQQVEAQPPQVIIVSSWLHMDGPDNYAKLQRWPWFEQFLASSYQLETDWHPTRRTRWWSREEIPASYRIYVLRGAQPLIR